MKSLYSLVALLSLSATALAQASNRQVQVVYDDVSAINENVLELTETTRAYQGGLVGQLPVAIDFTPVYAATRKGFYDSLLLPAQVSSSDAQLLIEHVNQTLAVNNPRAVDVLKSKKPLFQQAGSTPLIKSGLELLLFAHLSFSNEVAKRIPAELKAEGQSVIDVITVALQDGVAFYSS